MLRETIALISGDLKLKRYLKECRVTETAEKEQPAETFVYKGKNYDREKFIELVKKDFEKVPLESRIYETKYLVNGLEHSPNRELDLAYIEAYRRTLEGVLPAEAEETE